MCTWDRDVGLLQQLCRHRGLRARRTDGPWTGGILSSAPNYYNITLLYYTNIHNIIRTLLRLIYIYMRYRLLDVRAPLYYRTISRFKWRCGLSVLFIVCRYSKCLLIKHKGHIEFWIFFFFTFYKPPRPPLLFTVPIVHHISFYTHYTRYARTRFYASNTL